MTNIDQIDILKKAEKVVENTNRSMEGRGRSMMKRYPITFSLLVVFGIVAIHDGIKGVFEEFGFTQHPFILLIVGLVILIFTGTIFKRFEVE